MKGQNMSEINRQNTARDTEEQEKLYLVQSRFGAVAAEYLTSKVHASGQDLAWLVEAATLTGFERVLDVGTGAGHTAFALAPHSARVVALDLTRPMLEVAQNEGEVRQLTNISYLEGDAQAIPCEDGSFDVVACRKASHHFPRIRQAVQEWARVVKPGGKLLLVDSISPEEPELDLFLHEIEILRDPSHVRSQRISEWRILLEGAGFVLNTVREWGIVLDVADWTQRMRTPPEVVTVIEQRLRTASPATDACLRIEEHNGALTFTLPTVFIVGIKAEQK
jgi:ubiquinone/menaquinone biosynthesis C-methylase UbiE